MTNDIPLIQKVIDDLVNRKASVVVHAYMLSGRIGYSLVATFPDSKVWAITHFVNLDEGPDI